MNTIMSLLRKHHRLSLSSTISFFLSTLVFYFVGNPISVSAYSSKFQGEETSTITYESSPTQTTTPTSTEYNDTLTNTPSFTWTETESNIPTDTYEPSSTQTPSLTDTPAITDTPTCEGDNCTTPIPDVDLPPPSESEVKPKASRSSITQSQSNDYPFSCQGMEVVQVITGGDGFLGSELINMGDLSGDGKPELGASARQYEYPYRIMDIFNGSGYLWWKEIVANVDPLYYPRKIIAIGDIYSPTGQPDGKSEWAAYDVSTGEFWVFADLGGPVFEIVVDKFLPNFAGPIFSSIGDVSGDGWPEFAISKGNDLYVYSGAAQNNLIYKITFDNSPRTLLPIGDMNGDHVIDYVISTVNNTTYLGDVRLLSGADGSEIWRLTGNPHQNLGSSLLSLIDNSQPDRIMLFLGSRRPADSVLQYSLTAGSSPEFIQEIPGGYLTADAGDVNKDGKTEWLVKRKIGTSAYYDIHLLSFDGTELGNCIPEDGTSFSGMSVASDSDDDGMTEFALGVSPQNTVYIFEYSSTPIELISPLNWGIALSVHPTFTWKPQSGIQSYLLWIYPVDANGVPIETSVDIKKVIIACPPDADTCTFKPGIPKFNETNPNNFILPSGYTLETGGYAWKVFSLDDSGNVAKQSDFGFFQIPSLGGSWEELVQSGACTAMYGTNYLIKCRPEYRKGINPTWSEYDDFIYLWAEYWDIPPDIVKSIIANETVWAISPWPMGGTLFPPNETYGYEPGEDCRFFYIPYDRYEILKPWLLSDFKIINWAGDHKPWDTDCLEGKCTGPYNLDGNNLGMSIFDFAIGRGYLIANPTPFNNTDDIPGCSTHTNLAQYRISAGYGLGLITYIHEYDTIASSAAAYFGFIRPELGINSDSHIPPEYLYDPGFNIFMIGKILNDKRCSCNDPISAYTTDSADEWINPVSAYNGLGMCIYGKLATLRADYTSPKSLISGVTEIIKEYTHHSDSDYHLPGEKPGDACMQYACIPFAPWDAEQPKALAASKKDDSTKADVADPQLILSQSVNPNNDLGSVQVDLLYEQEEVNIGWVKIYRDQTRTELLWQSGPVGGISLPIWLETLEYQGQNIILTYWGDGVHSTRVIPIIWDGISFHEVQARDEDGRYTNINGDGGAIIPYSQGYIEAYKNNVGSSEGSSEVTIWSFNGLEFQIARKYFIPPSLSDDLPPVSTLTVTGSSGENGWYQSPVEIGINAEDENGVKTIHYKIFSSNGMEENTIPMDHISFPLGDGHWIIQYQATDTFGNLEAMHSIEILIDGSSPVVTSKINGQDVTQEWYSNAISIELAASDPPSPDGSEGSGVSRIEYAIDQETEWQQYQQPFTVDGEGQHQIRYRAIDAAGNVAGPYSLELGIDNNPPETFVDVFGCAEQNGFYNCSLQVELTAEDYELSDGSPSSGIDRIEYRISGSEDWISYTAPFSLATSGRYILEFRSVDRAGNIELAREIVIWLDLEAPVSSYTIIGVPDEQGRYAPGAKVVITSHDPANNDGSTGSGIQYIEYSVDDNNNWLLYSEPIGFEDMGTHTIQFRAVDNAGNREDIQTMEVEITGDSEPPSLTVNADPYILWPPNNKPVWVRIYGTAIDMQSGINVIHIEVHDEYKSCEPTVTDISAAEIIDGMWERSIPLCASRKGNDSDGRIYSIIITAIDNLGNMTIKDIMIIVPHDHHDIP